MQKIESNEITLGVDTVRALSGETSRFNEEHFNRLEISRIGR